MTSYHDLSCTDLTPHELAIDLSNENVNDIPLFG